MNRDDRTKIFYSIVISLCWINRRPITLPDLTNFLAMTAKQVRKELVFLEESGRISKVQIRKKSNGRICAAWVIADNDNLPPEIRDVCKYCGSGNASESCGDVRMCEPCFMAVKQNGKRINLTERQEQQMSLWYATIVTEPNEHTIG